MTTPPASGLRHPTRPAPGRLGTVRLLPVMGTVVTLDLRNRLPEPDLQRALAAASDVLHTAERLFSTYRPDSWVSRLRRGEVTRSACPSQLAEVLAMCAQAEAITDGYFTARWRGDGTVDPTGLVKGWAAGQASRVLLEHGVTDHCVNAAGDLALAGQPEPGRWWRIGIADPRTPGGLLGAVDSGRHPGQATLSWPAVATSGTTERGQHIIDPRDGRAANGLLAVTVAGPDPAIADGCATGLLAAGPAAADLLPRLARHGFAGCLLTADRRVIDPTGLLSRLPEPPPAKCAA